MYEIRNLYLEHISKDFLIHTLEDWYNRRLIDFYAFVLHDKDKYEDDEMKKPHYHLIIEWCETCQHITQRINKYLSLYDEFKNSNSFAKYVVNNKKFARYLIHLDNPEKFQYNRDCVVTNNNIVYDDLIKLVDNKKITPKNEMMNLFINDVQNGLINNLSELRNWFIMQNDIVFYMQHIKGLTDLLYSLNPSCRVINNDLYFDKVICNDDKGNPIYEDDLPF